MAKTSDIGSKRLISLSPDPWVQWLTEIPNLKTQEILSSNFQWVSREGDVLIRVSSPEIGEFLLLNEIQLRFDEEMPRRIRAYAGLAEEKYKCWVYPVVVNILQPSANTIIPHCYESNHLGIKAYQDYRVINLWEVDVNLVFDKKINSLLPFVPVLKGGNEEKIVRKALTELRQDDTLKDLESLLAFFASFVLNTSLVQQIMRWDMAVLEQSPWYQEIAQREQEKGKVKGKAEGKAEGTLLAIQLGLRLKFGENGLSLFPEISAIKDLVLLEKIANSLIDVSSLDELRKIYQS
jgi:predicted transposase YdaD